MSKSILFWLVVLLVLWFVYVHLIRKVPVK